MLYRRYPIEDFSILIGGKAGFGIDRAGYIIASALNQLGYRLYVYRDYPSIIRGGHTFSIIRASHKKISTHQDKVDYLLALNQDTVDLHKGLLKDGAVIIYDSDSVKIGPLPAKIISIAIPLSTILKEEGASEVMRNIGIIAALAKVMGVDWPVFEGCIKKKIGREIDLNLKIGKRCYDSVDVVARVEKIDQARLPLLTGNEALGLGLIRGGLDSYVAYPMTPSSPILHFLANLSEEFSIKVLHPESEIAVVLMALGLAYCGERAAVGTSGGGFCLMTEGLSFAAMAELPIVIILGQRPGPSTGLPTYSCQTELHFALNAGHGEFPRFITAPADPEEAYHWAQVALNISWKYQIPSIIMTDKNMGEGLYSFDIGSIKPPPEMKPQMWGRKGEYKRYLDTDTGISPMTFAPDKDAIIKVNSYEHDEFGITTEEPALTVKMQDKRLKKMNGLTEEMEGYDTVGVYGNKGSETALLSWGSNKGLCVEVAEALNIKVIQPIVLSPFPEKKFKAALKGVKKLIAVESNATGQLVKLIGDYGFSVNEKILKYDGRPFSFTELIDRVRGGLK